MILSLLLAGFLAVTPSALQLARDHQDRAALDKMVDQCAGEAAKAPNDVEAQYRLALAASYSAEVSLEQHDKKAARQAAERGIKAAEKAVALKPDRADSYRLLATLYGQAITDLMSGLSYGPRSKDAINKAVALAPNSSEVHVARGVGNYYLPPQMGGGTAAAMVDFRKAVELDPKNSEAYVWLGLCLRKDNKYAEARQAFTRALELDPERVWVKQQLEKTPVK
jgi:tetratricopeptide (TPR) repeat protein